MATVSKIQPQNLRVVEFLRVKTFWLSNPQDTPATHFLGEKSDTCMCIIVHRYVIKMLTNKNKER